MEEEKSTFDYSSPTSPSSKLQCRLDKLAISKDLANPAEHIVGFQKHFGLYANLPLSPKHIQIPDDSDEEAASDDQEGVSENNTDIEKEERNFVQAQRDFVHSTKSSAE